MCNEQFMDIAFSAACWTLPTGTLVSAFILFIFGLCCEVWGILGPQPGIEPTPPAVKGQSLDHWTAGSL